jgi:AAA+ superfamily predicted ATPase
MEIQSANLLLDAIVSIYEKASGCKLSSAYFESIQSELNHVKQYFKLNANESFILSLFIASHAEDPKSAEIEKLAKYIECSKLKLMTYNQVIEHLSEIGYIEKNINNNLARVLGSSATCYSVNVKIVTAVMANAPLPDVDKPKPMDNFKFLELVYTLGLERDEKRIGTNWLFKILNDLLKSHEDLPLVLKLKEFKLNVNDSYIFLYTVWKAIEGSRIIDIHRMLSGIYSDSSRRLQLLNDFVVGSHPLVVHQLVEILPAEMTNDTELELSDYAYSVLEEVGIKLKVKGYKRKDIIKPEDVMEKTLVFHDSELNQIETLQKLLQPVSFLQMQGRLKNKGLPTGVTVLLHGAPGTGKTEIAKQISKQTGRELMHVNISQCKTMWFGESEKLIKKIFTDYKHYAKNSIHKPILFFNEADAIISKRKELKGYNTDQTENAIQNILLEEIEFFDWILIATTNQVNNIDGAFERRFLYKIAFKTPCTSNRAKIWQLKLPDLTNSQAYQLAESFHFSGGQIDNIIRKKEINELLYGDAVSFNQIIEYCQEESLLKRHHTIGFKTLTTSL